LLSRCTSPAACACSSPWQTSTARDRVGRRKATEPREPLREGLALDVLHDDEGAAVLLAEVVDLDGVRVREPGRDARFAQEPSAEGLVLGERFGDELDRDLPVELDVAPEVDVDACRQRWTSRRVCRSSSTSRPRWTSAIPPRPRRRSSRWRPPPRASWLTGLPPRMPAAPRAARAAARRAPPARA
jgi:hypothetical protein